MKKGLDRTQNDQVIGLPQYKLHLKALNVFQLTGTLHLVPEHLPLKIKKTKNKKNRYIHVYIKIKKRSSNNRKRH